jgi:hypothetical protein
MAEPEKQPGKGTDAYSASKAPETQEEAHGRDSTGDSRLVPGGAMGSPAALGMSALRREDVPSGALKPEQLDVVDSPDDTGRNR